MACLSFLKLKLKRKPNTNRVVLDHDKSNNKASKNSDICTIPSNTIQEFTWEEIKSFTKNFSGVIGTGGFSIVYLAHFPGRFGRGKAAIKIYGQSQRLNQVLKQELDILLQLRHENIVKLLGYCHQQEESALVFEYVTNGSLQEKLYDHKSKKESVLSWKTRMAIAFQLCQAIEYLHEKCALQIVHGDIKAANILLDENFDCKLCDFGSAKMGFSSTVMSSNNNSTFSSTNSPRRRKQLMIGSPGYTDPHYLKTGIASKKNDIYSFGIILLELVTGRESFCSERGRPLTSEFCPKLRDGDCETLELSEIVDPRLEGDFITEEARIVLSISAKCLRQSPSLRPSVSHILRTFRVQISSIDFLFSMDKEKENLQYHAYK